MRQCYRQPVVLQQKTERSLLGRDKNGEAAPRTRSTSTSPDPNRTRLLLLLLGLLLLSVNSHDGPEAFHFANNTFLGEILAGNLLLCLLSCRQETQRIALYELPSCRAACATMSTESVGLSPREKHTGNSSGCVTGTQSRDDDAQCERAAQSLNVIEVACVLLQTGSGDAFPHFPTRPPLCQLGHVSRPVTCFPPAPGHQHQPAEGTIMIWQ
ncbi:unnamed protein product [Pleuronectes platessa]|uniref:Uncharacterized protein n=1 Tax=Pleuronectes platessa TaxID=8262 RepID=A0A9N7Z8U4_PLEPL|nr:unnamed protein product [Pleuronectes platessa]